MHFFYRAAWVSLMAVFALGFGVGAQEETGDPASLPLLESEWNLGTTFYGSGGVPQDPALVAAMDAAAAQGMSAFTFYADWSELEPQPGLYELDNLQVTLEWLHGLGIQPLLNITLIDIAELSLPADFLGDSGERLRDGLAFDDVLLIERLNSLLDEVVPLLVDNGGFLLLLGNEVDGYFNDVAGTDSTAYARLMAAARGHVQRQFPEMAVGVTVTGTEALAQGEVFQALRPVTDVLSFNYYGLSLETFQNLPLDEISPSLEQFAEIYGDDPMVITELGCPSAESNNSSLEFQAQCFEVMLATLRQYPNVRYVTVFTLYDWDRETCDFVVEFFGITADDLPPGYFERWRGYLCTLGILNADYSPKPAWEVFLQYLPSR